MPRVTADNDETVTEEVPVRRRRRVPVPEDAPEIQMTAEEAAAEQERMVRRRRKIAEDPNLTPEEAAMLLEKMERRHRHRRPRTEAACSGNTPLSLVNTLNTLIPLVNTLNTLL